LRQCGIGAVVYWCNREVGTGSIWVVGQWSSGAAKKWGSRVVGQWCIGAVVYWGNGEDG